MRRLSSLLLLLAVTAPALAADDDAPAWKAGGDVRVRYYDMQNIWDWNYGDDADHWPPCACAPACGPASTSSAA